MSAPEPHPANTPSRWAMWLPLGLFGGFAGAVLVALFHPGDHDVASQMIGHPLPPFDLPAAAVDRPGLARAALIGGRPRLLNIFASWCVPCAAEAPQLDALARAGVEIDGVAIRDTREDLAGFLALNGNPYTRIGADRVSAIQLAIGSSGVPESFVIDAHGTIRYQHIGDIREQDVPMILARLREAQP